MEAIIKMISGLNDSFLRFDINAFLSQIKDEKITYMHLSKTTHPSLFIRARALLRFSISTPFLKLHNKRGGSELNKIDKLIRKDLKKSKRVYCFSVFITGVTCAFHFSFRISRYP